MNIIGISCGYHDAAGCLRQDGPVLRRSLPEAEPAALDGNAAGIGAGSACLDSEPGNRVTEHDGAIEIVDHHLSHAASAYFLGFEEAAILTVDGVGEWPTTTYGSRSRFESTPWQCRVPGFTRGLFYSAVTGDLGFEVNEREYKAMGLLPFGRPTYVKQIREIIEDGPRGQFRLNPRYFPFLQTDSIFFDSLPELLSNPPPTPESEIAQFHMDVARSAQVVLEEVLLSKVRYLHFVAGLFPWAFSPL
jgi:carbamoyltransferase